MHNSEERVHSVIPEGEIHETDTNYDVVIIGAGVIGCSIARVLSSYELRVLVLEKDSDVASGASGRNSAVVHAGFNNKPGSLMAKFCVEGNRRFETLCDELHVPYRKTGKLVVAFDDEDLTTLSNLLEQGVANGCEGLQLLDGDELEGMSPATKAIAALWSPNTAIINPFLYVIATAEHAADNGVGFRFDEEVIKLHRDCVWNVGTTSRQYRTHVVVNASGLQSDWVSALGGVRGYELYPCRGQYLILDKGSKLDLPTPIYPAPRKGAGGLGVHLTPTIEGNVIVGPSSEYIEDREDYATTSDVLARLREEAHQLVPSLPLNIIGAYSGVRPKQTPPDKGGFADFVIKEEPNAPCFINLIGIESPGLTASMPIAEMVVELISKRLALHRKSKMKPPRKRGVPFRDLSWKERQQLVEQDPRYGEIVCRCQEVTKRELLDAINNPLGVKSVSGIKYRAWTTTGRCQGGYCLTRIVHALCEAGLDEHEIRLRQKGSELFTGAVK